MNNSSILGVLFGVFGICFLLIIALVVFAVLINWKMYEKAGKPGWASIVPIYNTIVLFEIIGYKWYYIFFVFAGGIPVLGYVVVLLFNISYSIKLAKSFGQSVGFGIGLAFLNPVFAAIIAFDKDIKYIGPSVNGDIDFNDLF